MIAVVWHVHVSTACPAAHPVCCLKFSLVSCSAYAALPCSYACGVFFHSSCPSLFHNSARECWTCLHRCICNSLVKLFHVHRAAVHACVGAYIHVKAFAATNFVLFCSACTLCWIQRAVLRALLHRVHHHICVCMSSGLFPDPLHCARGITSLLVACVLFMLVQVTGKT
ncbi:hypothetical protein COO60DRAFT_977445 [Scenedesmus sp. NREL 46B-D3]|nr:hypothetical protein COO60DRAFT_977445 [Scenedesmus sp. NREL 46B-D3]